MTAVIIYAVRHRADLKSGQLAAVVASTDDAIIGTELDGTITDAISVAGLLCIAVKRAAAP